MTAKKMNAGFQTIALANIHESISPLHAAESSSMSWPMNCFTRRSARRRRASSASWRPSLSASPY
jgi:hypothetical protein